jgi:YHS domain-containing protein
MIRKLFLLLCVSLLVGGQAFACGGSSCSANSCGGSCSCGKSHSSNQKCASMSLASDQKAAIEVGNKICPVTKRKIGEMGPPAKFTYNGKIYNLCCPMCANSFNKNPKKYSKIAEQQV